MKNKTVNCFVKIFDLSFIVVFPKNLNIFFLSPISTSQQHSVPIKVAVWVLCSARISWQSSLKHLEWMGQIANTSPLSTFYSPTCKQPGQFSQVTYLFVILPRICTFGSLTCNRDKDGNIFFVISFLLYTIHIYI